MGISPGAILKGLGQVGTLSQLLQGARKSSGIFFRNAKNVLISPWSKFAAKTDANEWVKVAKLAAGTGLAVWSTGQGLRTYHDARGVLNQTRNRDGSVVWSGAQTALYTASAALPALGMLMPGSGFGLLMKAAPIAALLPAVTGWAMDQVQAFATADLNHPLANFFRIGFDNHFIENYDKGDPAAMGRSKLLPIWYRTVKPMDKKFLKNFGIDFNVTEFETFNQKGRVVA